MRNLMTIAFEAHHDERNHHRRYEMMVGRGLFGDWTVSVGYARTGRSGQMKQFAGPDDDEMKCIFRERLRRRLSAPEQRG